MSRETRGGLIIFAVILALASLVCLGDALPNIDGPLFEAAERRPYGIAFAILATSAIVCFHVAKELSAQRIVIEGVLIFVVFLCIGLAFNG
jgi:hypothetical protein